MIPGAKRIIAVVREDLEELLYRLANAVLAERTEGYCLRLWSRFIRARDGNRCVICNSRDRLAAHHIVRKSLLPNARFETGNGITLCPICHSEPHADFNRRPDISLPVDAQGGEKLDHMTMLLGSLLEDAEGRELLCDRYYYFSDETLDSFRKMQTIPERVQLHGPRLKRAYWIWNQTPHVMIVALLRANLGMDT